MNKIDNDLRREAIIAMCNVPDGRSRKQIAEGLGLRKHPALNAFIERMVTDGYLWQTVKPNPNGSNTYLYQAAVF